MEKTYRNLLVVCVLVIFALLAYVFSGSGDNQDAVNRLENEKSELIAEIDRISTELAETKSKLNTCESDIKILETENEDLKLLIEEETDPESCEDILKAVQAENIELTALNEELRIMLKETDSMIGSPIYINEFELEILEYKGIEDVSVIIEDLRNSPEVIQTEAVLGGTMMFEDIYLLNHQYVYATMSDGHIYVVGIYRFTVSESLDFIWESIYEAEF